MPQEVGLQFGEFYKHIAILQLPIHQMLIPGIPEGSYREIYESLGVR